MADLQPRIFELWTLQHGRALLDGEPGLVLERWSWHPDLELWCVLTDDGECFAPAYMSATELAAALWKVDEWVRWWTRRYWNRYADEGWYEHLVDATCEDTRTADDLIDASMPAMALMKEMA